MFIDDWIERYMFPIATILGFMLLGSVLTGGDDLTWFEGLNMAPWALSLSAWGIVGLLYYALHGYILYRLQVARAADVTVSPAFELLFSILLLNEFWNYLLFEIRDLLAAALSLTAFAGLSIVFLLTLRRTDTPAANAYMLYMPVVAYNIAWIWSVYALNT